MNFVAVIPARYSSTRFIGKPLAEINGKPMVIHVLNRARESGADRVIVATDHKKIASVVENAGGEICMTRSDHQSGIERLEEVVEKYKFNDKMIIVNLQVDEPMIPAKSIRQVVKSLIQNQVEITTLAVKIHNVREAFNPNVVKVVLDSKNYALYFSRATIPWDRERFTKSRNNIGNTFLRHIGIYSYYAGFLRRYVNWKPSLIEKIEMLEQLRILWYGEKIYVTVVNKISGISIDTLDDLTYLS